MVQILVCLATLARVHGTKKVYWRRRRPVRLKRQLFTKSPRRLGNDKSMAARAVAVTARPSPLQGYKRTTRDVTATSREIEIDGLGIQIPQITISCMKMTQGSNFLAMPKMAFASSHQSSPHRSNSNSFDRVCPQLIFSKKSSDNDDFVIDLWKYLWYCYQFPILSTKFL